MDKKINKSSKNPVGSINDNQSFSLNSTESRVFFSMGERKSPFFTISDVKTRLGNKLSDEYLRITLSKLEKKRRVKRIERGKYMLNPSQSGMAGDWMVHEFAVADFIAPKPYYLSYYSALSYWKATTQIPRTVFVVSQKHKEKTQFGGASYRFIKKKEFNSPSTVVKGYDNSTVTIASVEQTVIDCFERPELCGGITEAANLIRESQFKIDWDKTTEMIGRASSATQRRLYYIMDLLGKHNELWWQFENTKFPGYRQLDPSRCAKGKHSTKFGLLLNVGREEIVRETMNY